jgi:phosphopantothenoylcysteine decarboxylase
VGSRLRLMVCAEKVRTLGRPPQVAGGLCDNLLTCVVRAWDYSKPVYVAPAMNSFMWDNPFTVRHLDAVLGLGMSLIPPVTKRLACGDYGNGAMAEPAEICRTVKLFFGPQVVKRT